MGGKVKTLNSRKLAEKINRKKERNENSAKRALAGGREFDTPDQTRMKRVIRKEPDV